MEKHFFAVDFFGWAVDEDIDEAIRRRIEDTGKLINLDVWEIPLPKEANYSIRMYAPKVVGAKLIRRITVEVLEGADQIVVKEEKTHVR